jgi:hypothetical protein
MVLKSHHGGRSSKLFSFLYGSGNDDFVSGVNSVKKSKGDSGFFQEAWFGFVKGFQDKFPRWRLLREQC